LIVVIFGPDEYSALVGFLRLLSIVCFRVVDLAHSFCSSRCVSQRYQIFEGPPARVYIKLGRCDSNSSSVLLRLGCPWRKRPSMSAFLSLNSKLVTLVFIKIELIKQISRQFKSSSTDPSTSQQQRPLDPINHRIPRSHHERLC
jgi:hypothetical protein